MKKQRYPQYKILLFFSVLLFSGGIYLLSIQPVLGASVSKEDYSPNNVVSVPAAEIKEQTKEKKTSTDKNKKTDQPQEVYIVKAGQTLWEIAQETGQSVSTLMIENQLSNSIILEGQEVVIKR